MERFQSPNPRYNELFFCTTAQRKNSSLWNTFQWQLLTTKTAPPITVFALFAASTPARINRPQSANRTRRNMHTISHYFSGSKPIRKTLFICATATTFRTNVTNRMSERTNHHHSLEVLAQRKGNTRKFENRLSKTSAFLRWCAWNSDVNKRARRAHFAWQFRSLVSKSAFNAVMLPSTLSLYQSELRLRQTPGKYLFLIRENV